MARGKWRGSFAAWGGALTIALMGAFVLWAGWTWLPAYLAAINLVTFGFYGLDKLQSRRPSAPRVPERTLHAIAFAGGSPGALVGQQVFRHKTMKKSFRRTFWALALLQAALVAAWLWWIHGGR